MIPNRIRAAVNSRDEWTCQRCGKHAGVIGASIHHRKGRQAYQGFDPNALSNLVTLCGSGTTGCHGWVTEHPSEAYATGWAVRRLGNDHPSLYPYGPFPTADKDLIITVGNDAQFRTFAAALGVPELAEDPRFTTNMDRVEHREELRTALEGTLSTQTAAHWRDVLQAERLPVGLVSTVAEGVELAESLGLEPTVEVQDRSGAPAGRQFRHPVQWDPPVAHPRHAPPALGADTAAVNTWLDAR